MKYSENERASQGTRIYCEEVTYRYKKHLSPISVDLPGNVGGLVTSA